MPAVSDEDLQKLQDENQKLREKLVTAQSKRSEQEAARQREYQATMLKAENAQLQAQVNAAEEAAKVGSTKAGASTVQDAAEQRLADAKAVLEAPARPPEPEASDAPGTPEKNNGGN